MRFLRWAKWTGITLLTLLAGVALMTTAILGTESGRLWLVDRALGFAARAGVQLELQNLRAPELGQWRGARLQVVLHGQPLVELQDFELVWQPSALLERRLMVQRLTAAQVAYHQPAGQTKPAEPESDAAFNPPPVQIVVQTLQIDRLTLHNLVPQDKGTLPDYRISGGLDAFGPDSPLHLQLEIASLDSEEMLLKIDSQARSQHEVHFKGTLRESAGGLLGTLARWPVDQPIQAEFAATLEQGENQLRLALEDLRLPLSGHKLQAQGNISYTNRSGTLAVNELLLLIDDKAQKLRGGYSALDLWAQVNLDEFPLDLLTPWVADLQGGDVSGQVELNWLHQEEGRWPNVSADAKTKVTYRHQTLDASINGRLENKLLTLQPSSLQLEEALLRVAGLLDIEGNTSNLQGTLTNFDSRLLAKWSVPVPEELQAQAPQTRFTLTGSLLDPLVNLDTHVAGHYQERNFSLAFKGEASRYRARFAAAQLISDNSEVQAKGVLDWTGNTTKLQVTVAHLTQELLKLLPPEMIEAVPEELSFDASGALQVSGPLRKPSIQVQGAVAGTYHTPAEELPYKLTLDGGVKVGNLQELKLDVQRMELEIFDKPTLVLQGNYNAQSADLQLRLEALPTRMLAALGWQKLDGEAEADIHVQGSLQQPIINGFFEYRDQLPGRGGRVPVAIHSQMSTEGGNFNLLTTITHNTDPAGSLTLSLPLGQYLHPPPGQQSTPLFLDAKGDWDLRFLRLFVDLDDHRIDGKLAADFTVRGTAQEPIFVGELRLTEGTYNNSITGTQLDDITVTLQGSGQSVLVKDARARSGDDGSITLSGEIHWQEQRRQQNDAISLALEARRVMLLSRRDLQGEVQGKFNVNGSFEELWVKGEMEISPLNASVESAISSSIPEIKVREVSDEESEAKSSVLPIVHLDITLFTERQAYLRGRGLDTELSGRILVQGTATKPTFNGLFTTRRGHIDLFGKRFVLENGEVRFNNDGAILRIPAVYKANSGEIEEIRAELYGTADKPQLKLSSVPARPDDEILARLIFDKSIQEITAFEAIRLAGAVRTLTSGGGFDPVDSARQMLGVDALTIDNSTTESGSGVSIGVGKYISEKVYLELKRTPNPTQPWQGSVQVELTPKLTLQSGTSAEGGGGAELLWKRDY
ncbi:MAG: translocation/assembly module TamB domain-containing protein [Cellvibrionaceae bacterium]|nr:translocation/assembly module TamB domain-containing protein [Cellvibrionaceae bacterium]